MKCLMHLKTVFSRAVKSILFENISSFNNVSEDYIRAVSPVVSESITLSTLHGCPPEEIEKISHYFLTEKKIHTYVKCNPTLLGYDFTRNILINGIQLC